MATDESDPAGTGEKSPSRERLESWKDIANYLHRGVRTVQRWEKEESLPVHRHLHTKLGTVYAYRPEVDAWWDSRRKDLESTGRPEDCSDQESGSTTGGFRKFWVPAALISLAILVVITYFLWQKRSPGGSALPFEVRDWVLIVPFENRSGESVLDGTLEYALDRELCNSTFVNVVPRERVNDTLKLMQRPLSSPVDIVLGREICIRDGGIRALVTGRVTKLHTTYVLSATILDPNSGVAVASVSEEAASQEEVLAAVRRLSRQVRQKLGEKLPRVSRSPGTLEEATTPSLRALQFFSRAMGLYNQREWAQAAPLLELAIREDPQFASAHIYLARSYSNLEDEEAAAPHYEKAFSLSEATADHERYFIEGSYYMEFAHDYEKALRAFQILVGLYPDHFWGVKSLKMAYRSVGMRKQAVLYAARAAQIRPNDLPCNWEAAAAYLEDSDDPGGARPYIQRAQALLTPETARLYPQEALGLALFPADEQWRENHVREAADELDRVASKANSVAGEVREAHLEGVGYCYMTLGKFKTAAQAFDDLSDLDARNFQLAVLAVLRDDPTSLREYSSRLDGGGASMDSPMPPILMARAGLLAKAERGLSDLRKLLTGDPDIIGFVKVVEAELALARGQRSRAISLFEEGLPLIPSKQSMTFLGGTEALARAYEQQGKRAEAVRVLETATAEKSPATLDRGFFWIRHRWLLAQLYRKDGRAQDAERIEDHLRRLLVCADPDFPLFRELSQLAAVDPKLGKRGY